MHLKLQFYNEIHWDYYQNDDEAFFIKKIIIIVLFKTFSLLISQYKNFSE